MSCKMNCKKGVTWNASPAIDAAQDTIIDVFKRIGGSIAVVTSCKDGAHSKNSAHHQAPDDMRPSDALDLRIIHLFLDKQKDQTVWWGKIRWLAEKLAEALNAREGVKERFYVILEDSHIHIECAVDSPNIRGYKPGLFVYMTDGAKSKMSGMT